MRGAFCHTISRLEKIKWDILDHPPVQSEPHAQRFPLVSSPKETSRWEKFDDDEVQEKVMSWFKGLVADFYDSGIHKLVPRLNKCLDNAGEYVEK